MIDIHIKTPHAFSTKADGSMKHESGGADIQNVKTFLKKNNLSQSVVCMGQVHGSDVSIVKTSDKAVVPEVDGLVTNMTDITLGVVTADCLPILFYDPQKKVIGVGHAGSKGLLRGIVGNVIHNFKQKFASDSRDILVYIAPSIEQQCYEVGNDLVDRFEKQYPWMEKTFVKRLSEEKSLLDLRNIALQCLMKEGILKEHIEIDETCTKCNSATLYSYRGGDMNGRFVSMIALE